MGFISGLVIGGTIMLIVGWVALPEPLWFREWWAKHGWADRD